MQFLFIPRRNETLMNIIFTRSCQLLHRLEIFFNLADVSSHNERQMDIMPYQERTEGADWLNWVGRLFYFVSLFPIDYRYFIDSLGWRQRGRCEKLDIHSLRYWF